MNVRVLLLLGLGAMIAPVAASAADRSGAEDEARLLEVLGGSASVAEKESACAGLQRGGTERAVPALAALLSDPQLAHAARFALETMPSPAAGRALVAALATTSGMPRVGLMGTLAVRRESAAVPALARLLAENAGGGTAERAGQAAAAAAALGEMEDPAARAALTGAWRTAADAVRPAVVDALLEHARRLLAQGARAEAAGLWAEIHGRESRLPVRVAAYCGVIRSAGEKSRDLLVAALTGPAGAEQAAALRVLPDLRAAGLEQALADVLPRLDSALQAAVLGGWLQRENPPGRGDVRPLLRSASPDVRLTAVRALGRVGDAQDVDVLLDLAAAPSALQAAARLALTELRDGRAGDRLMESLHAPREELRVEAARALGLRGESRAAAPLLAGVQTEAAPVRLAVWRALVLVAGDAEAEAIVRMAGGAWEAAWRAEAARALAMIFERLQPGDRAGSLRALLQAVGGGATAVRLELLPVCSVLNAPEVRRALRSALADPVPEIRAAAVRAAAQSIDVELVEDLVRIAVDPAWDEFRDLATRACVRLLAREAAKGAEGRRATVWGTLVAAPLTTGQKRTILAGLASGRTAADFELAERFLAEADVWPEAVATLAAVGGRLAFSEGAADLLRLVLGCALDAELRRLVEGTVRALEARAPLYAR